MLLPLFVLQVVLVHSDITISSWAHVVLGAIVE